MIFTTVLYYSKKKKEKRWEKSSGLRMAQERKNKVNLCQVRLYISSQSFVARYLPREPKLISTNIRVLLSGSCHSRISASDEIYNAPRQKRVHYMLLTVLPRNLHIHICKSRSTNVAYRSVLYLASVRELALRGKRQICFH